METDGGLPYWEDADDSAFDYDDTTGLEGDVRVEGNDAERAKIASLAAQAEMDRLEQAQKMRGRFFWFGVAAASSVVAVSCFVAVQLAWTRQMTSAVAVSFFTGVTVEVLGIVAIIANYLFPKDNGESSSPARGQKKK